MSYAIGGEAAYYQPPAPPGPECQWCDGTGMVDISAIVDAGGTVQTLPGGVGESQTFCPRCLELPGVEPIIEKEAP